MKIRLRPELELDEVNSEYLSHGTVYEVVEVNNTLHRIVDDQGGTISVCLGYCDHAGGWDAWEIVEE
tara:strand:- start:185 stop:385 length:201 start_codon:yes stop_codon:yes gene_type:complete